MPREELPPLESREEQNATAPVALLLVAIALVLLAPSARSWFRALPPVWDAGSPPPTIHFCGRDYEDPRRVTERLPADPTAIEPIVEAVDGQPLHFPAGQTTRFNGYDVCSTVLQIHDGLGWVAYGLVGGP
jgi:hypothetical protein